MISALITFLVAVVVLIVVLWAVKTALDYMELPPPVRQIVLVVVGLVGLLFLLSLIPGVFRGGPAAFPTW